jgi:hypothetical protein
MLPHNTTANSGDQGLIDVVFVRDGLLRPVGGAEKQFDGLNLGGGQPSSAPTFPIPVKDVVVVSATKPMIGTAALHVVALMQDVQRIWVAVVCDKPTYAHTQKPHAVN